MGVPGSLDPLRISEALIQQDTSGEENPRKLKQGEEFQHISDDLKCLCQDQCHLSLGELWAS